MAVVVFLLIIALGEAVALYENYQNNSFMQQYLTQNSAVVAAEISTLIVLGVAFSLVAYRASKRSGLPKGPGPFSRLGTLITKRHRAIIAIWILLVILSLPLATRIDQAVTSQSGNSATAQSESDLAQQLITQEFPHQTSNSTALLVVQSGDVTNNATKQFALALETKFLAPGELSYVENFTSIYTVERAILVGGISSNTFTIYGVPSIYLQNWTASPGNVTARDGEANATTTAFLASTLPRGQSSTAVILGYYGVFYQFWKSTADNSTLTSNPQLREAQAISQAVPTFAQSLARTSPSFASFFTDTYSLGPRPTTIAVTRLANETIIHNSLSDLPIGVPASLLQQFISPKNDTMLVSVSFSRAPGTFASIQSDPIFKDVLTMRNDISGLITSVGGPSKVYVTGDVATTVDSSVASSRDLSRIEPVTVAAILVLVGVFFFAVATPVIPLASIGLALIIAQGLIYVIGTFIVPVQDTTVIFLTTIMLGVGTDYAIFLIARYREERVEGRKPSEAVQTSVTWVGESITTSGMTVILAFGALSIGSFALLRSMGVAIGTGVLIALLVSLTLIPAVLRLAGDRVFWPRSGARFERYAAKSREKRAANPSYFRRAASLSARRPKLVLLLALIISLPAIYVSLTATTTYDFIAGLPQAESVQGLTLLQQSFGAGRIGPTQVVVHFPTAILQTNGLTSTVDQALEHLSQTIAGLSNVEQVDGPTRPEGSIVNATNLASLGPATSAAVLGTIGKDNRTAILTVILVQDPFTSTSLNTVQQIRSSATQLRQTDQNLANAVVLVGGQTASTADFARQAIDQFANMRIIVLVGIFVILLLVLGSYVLPVAAILSIGLSITWAYAATLVFFKNVLSSDVLFLIPLILFLLLFGIGMDYNIFILTRIREEAQKGKGSREAVVDAVDRTGGIITALALILAGAIGSLMLSSNRLLEGFGFAIALAVVLDAMVVRTYLVPATMSLLGKWAWWGPKRLQRVKLDREETKTSPGQQRV